MTSFSIHALALAGALGLTASSAQAQSSPCPGNMASYFNLKLGDAIKCTCPALDRGRAVWGTARYTIDSDVCRAAVHAGAMPAAGGEITVYLAEGCPIFRNSAKNSVQSTNYGPYGRTFHFTPEAPACEARTKDDPAPDCPYSMAVFAQMKPGQSWRCKCSDLQIKTAGAVWGDGRYTADSSTCGAAFHAGTLPLEGGEVTLYTDLGCKRYLAAQKYGLASRERGEQAMSFAFVHPLPACAN